MSKPFIDSNVFFYAKIMDRVFGKSCSEIIRDVASGSLQASTSALVPIEVANALRKYGMANDIVDEVRAIFSLGLEVYSLDSADAQEAAEIYAATGISPYDCLHVAVMKRNGLSEIVFADKEFEKIPWIKRLDPKSMGGSGSTSAT